ncbi:MAG: biotin--[acetyl-CoA-carboxylase] ligase [Thermoanaerobaculia bacterium]|nr:MAG: biotin--[acetyl-CoA-carboxylase] ligase [Thermoanaerobaculia bacterium]
MVAVDRVDSTQRLARTLLDRHLAEDETPRPFVVVAEAQSAGRGRQGRSWRSGAGQGVWASFVLELDAPRAQSLPMRVAVALATAVNAVLGAETCRLKWPNDLVVGRAKLGGLLIDAVTRPDGVVWAVVGYGLNHEQPAGELPAGEAVSLRLAAGGRPLPTPAELLARAQTEVCSELSSETTGWLERYRALSVHRSGDRIVCDLPEGRLEGRFAGFDALGFLVVETGTGARTVRSGEVFAW